ncbi:ATP-binding protein [Nonomuraea mesophila]|uniref:ATP-binding protein n=1 Tax=Nonomuraea mesophila TaxID=2530382 RepID=A0A4R5FTF7_9ACTN|nr:ATP-binding protein [Nonomuraea mesophila]TDE56841.1 ATP-binding protein [Nonomuraea mesophila]
MQVATQTPRFGRHTYVIGRADSRRIPAKARDLVTGWVGTHHPRADDLRLVVDELVTNAIEYGMSDEHRWVRISLYAEHDGFILSVADPGRAGTTPALREPDDDGGRGLLIVDRLTCGNWGHYVSGMSERVVWALLR